MKSWKIWSAALLLAGCLGISGASAEDAFPSHTVKLISPFEAGGGTDVIARIFADAWSKALKQTVIVENHPGAAGAIGADIVAQSKPDGYTVCWCTISQVVILPLIDPKLSYNPQTDLQAISLVYQDDGTIVVRNGLGVSTLKEFVALAKENPHKYSYGSGGIGTIVHLAGVLFTNQAGIEMTHIPYKGEQYGVTDLLAGRIDMFPLSTTNAAHLGDAGQLKVLAVRSAERNPLLPNVPTIAEAGYPGAESPVLVGLFVSAHTPDAIVAKLYEAAATALQSPEVRAKILTVGGRIIGSDPKQTTAQFKMEYEKWSKVVKTVNFNRQ